MRILFALLTAVFLGNFAAAATVGDDGLHIQPWIRDTFKDLQEDLDEANAEGKRLAIFFEQRGCIYCTKMHENVYPDPELSQYIDENFFVIQFVNNQAWCKIAMMSKAFCVNLLIFVLF